VSLFVIFPLVWDTAGVQTGIKRLQSDTGRNQINNSDSTVLVYPRGDIYRAGRFKRIWFGNNYRQEWITPTELPLFDFKSENGNMKIIKVGGNFQTRTLRLEDEMGKEWVLRSVDKDASARIPEILRTDAAEDIVQDQMSASHPYAALAVPKIAEAAEIYHTNPRLVYVSEKSLPKEFDEKWAGVYLFEERPDGNRDDVASFGYSVNIISTTKMIEKVTENHDSQVDQKLYLKSRLVDMLISDWDRHEDQLRWASFKEDGKTIYRPVPRDRDMVFFVNEGILPWLSTRKFLLRKIQGLDYNIKDLSGLNTQAQRLDRRFINQLTRNEWVIIAKKLKTAITDEIIDQAINDMPDQIAEINGNTIKSKLKSRRNNIDRYAEEYYSILAKKVDIVGTDKRDLFIVERINDTTTKVTISAIDKKEKNEYIYYERIFIFPETREIMLYGLDGNDIFKLTGNVEKGIKTHIVGGKGKDETEDKSHVSGITRKTIVYDDTVKTLVRASNETRKVISTVPEKYSYNYYAFNYNKFVPLLYAGYSYDDGIHLAGGFTYKSYDFLRKPFAANHNITFKYSMATEAKELSYKGIYTDMFNVVDVHLKFHIRDPKFTQNYFGLGNETIKSDPNVDYYRVRIGEFFINPELSYPINPRASFSAGLFYQNSRIESTSGRYISDIQANGLNMDIFERKEFIGVSAGFKHDSRDNTVFPTRGIYWKTRNHFYYGLSGSDYTFDRITGEISLYLSPWKAAGHVAAFRMGGAVNAGDYEFYQANTLGSLTNLRGFPYNRYSGYASFYQNSDIRIKLSRVKSYITKGYFGLIIFNDLGRVWQKNEDSFKWHHGYGGGLWISPYEIAIITAMYEFSKDEDNGLFSVRFGFLF
jgi:hypothetical protein